MKATFVAAGIGAVLGLMPTLAIAGDKVDMAEITCKQFLADQEGILPTVFWIDGYLSNSTGNTVVDPDQLVQNVKDIATACQGEPDKKIIELLEQ